MWEDCTNKLFDHNYKIKYIIWFNLWVILSNQIFFMEGVDSKVVVGSLFGLGIAALGGAAVYKHFYHS